MARLVEFGHSKKFFFFCGDTQRSLKGGLSVGTVNYNSIFFKERIVIYFSFEIQ